MIANKFCSTREITIFRIKPRSKKKYHFKKIDYNDIKKIIKEKIKVLKNKYKKYNITIEISKKALEERVDY